MRTSIFGPFSAGKKCALYTGKCGSRQSSAQGLDGCRWHKALDTKSLEFATWRSPKKKKSLLVWESFRAHLTDPLKQALPQTNTDIAVIPSRLTSVLQPLNVCLNKPLKDCMRERWMTWIVEGEKSFTLAGNVKAPSWVLEAWRGLPVEMFAHSFKKCEISNSIGGTEDDILWKEDTDIKQESKNDESEDGDVYEDQLTEEQWQSFFRESDDEDEFEGF